MLIYCKIYIYFREVKYIRDNETQLWAISLNFRSVYSCTTPRIFHESQLIMWFKLYTILGY
jgi:hypothetical protein